MWPQKACRALPGRAGGTSFDLAQDGLCPHMFVPFPGRQILNAGIKLTIGKAITYEQL